MSRFSTRHHDALWEQMRTVNNANRRSRGIAVACFGSNNSISNAPPTALVGATRRVYAIPFGLHNLNTPKDKSIPSGINKSAKIKITYLPVVGINISRQSWSEFWEELCVIATRPESKWSRNFKKFATIQRWVTAAWRGQSWSSHVHSLIVNLSLTEPIVIS